MNRLVEDHRDALNRLCRAYHVDRMDLFGSAAQGGFNPATSDLDFLVRFKPCSPGQHYERYFGLLESLQALFDHRIDLVEADAMRNPYFVRRVNESRTSIYVA